MVPRSAQRVNYDLIAHLYDEPGRDHELDAHLVQFLSERGHRLVDRLKILDTGCGTGKQLAADRQEFPEMFMVGLDLFHGMLQEAFRRCQTVTWVQGDSADPPFQGDTFDYITNQYSYSHVIEKRGMISAIFRLLIPGGRFVITHIDPWLMRDWILYQYFPAARERDFRDFLPVEELVALLEEAGFINIRVDHQYRCDKAELSQFLAYASRRYRTSQLMVISDGDYQAGITQLKSDLIDSGKVAGVDSDFCLVTMSGDKP